jgi:hypothetical protein
LQYEVDAVLLDAYSTRKNTAERAKLSIGKLRKSSEDFSENVSCGRAFRKILKRSFKVNPFAVDACSLLEKVKKGFSTVK